MKAKDSAALGLYGVSLIFRTGIFGFCALKLLGVVSSVGSLIGAGIAITTMFCVCYLPEISSGNGNTHSWKDHFAWSIPFLCGGSLIALIYLILQLPQQVLETIHFLMGLCLQIFFLGLVPSIGIFAVVATIYQAKKKNDSHTS